MLPCRSPVFQPGKQKGKHLARVDFLALSCIPSRIRQSRVVAASIGNGEIGRSATGRQGGQACLLPGNFATAFTLREHCGGDVGVFMLGREGILKSARVALFFPDGLFHLLS